MALFAVERYLGDETEVKETNNNKDHFAKLISKIEQRKKSKTTPTINGLKNNLLGAPTSHPSEDTRQEHTVKRKKHKLKQKEEISEDRASVNAKEEVEGNDHATKQKSHKRKHVDEKGDSETFNDGILEHSVKKKKHKRKKETDEIIGIEISSVNENDGSENLLNHTDEHVGKKHKKKKRKKEHSVVSTEDSGDINEHDVSQITNDGEETENDSINSSEKPENDFQIIGDHSFNKNKEVRCVLPQWLAKPSVISVDLKHLEDDIYSIPHLSKMLVKKLQENGITHFFPVQTQLIPFLLKSERTRSPHTWPVDVCVSAPTGSGKTLAFVLPIVQTLLFRLATELRVIVILPVQDLASQVASVFRKYTKGTGLSVYLALGGTPLHEEQKHLVKQRADGTYESLVDILVTTPGRLVDHIYSTQGFTLKKLRFIVIDEADRVMDNFQNDWLYHLDNHLSVPGCPPLTIANLRSMPMRPQKLLFSATLSSDPEKLSELSLFQPRLFTSVVSSTKKEVDGNSFIGKYTTPAELVEYMVVCDKMVKPLVLFRLIVREEWNHVLVFASTTQNVHNLATLLSIFGSRTEHSLQVGEINAAMPRDKRQQLIESFTAGQVNVLVSTDSLARGIDIPGARYVINYDVPKFIKSYIHRIGRTGRAGQDGTAVSLLSHEQVERFTNLLKTAGKHEDVTELKVAEEELEGFEDMYKEALKKLKQISEEQQRRKQQEKIMSNKMVVRKVVGQKTTRVNPKVLTRLKKKKKKGTKSNKK